MSHRSALGLRFTRHCLIRTLRDDLRWQVLCFILSALLLGAHAVVDQAAGATDASDAASLWQTAPPRPASDTPSIQRKPWVLRERDISLDLALLGALKNAAQRPAPRVVVDFFDGQRHEMDITSTVSRFNDTAVIRGSFKPPSRGDFTLVATGSLLVGSLQVGDRLYKTEHAGNGRLRLLEVDPRKMPPE